MKKDGKKERKKKDTEEDIENYSSLDLSFHGYVVVKNKKYFSHIYNPESILQHWGLPEPFRASGHSP